MRKRQTNTHIGRFYKTPDRDSPKKGKVMKDKENQEWSQVGEY